MNATRNEELGLSSGKHKFKKVNIMISAEQFAEWKEHPVTKEIFSDLKELKSYLQDTLAEGASLGKSAEETHGATNKLVGQIGGIDQLLNISFADVDDVDVIDVG